MYIICNNVIINVDNIEAIYTQDGKLCCEVGQGAFEIKDAPNNALSQIAVALAEGKQFIEFENARR